MRRLGPWCSAVALLAVAACSDSTAPTPTLHGTSGTDGFFGPGHGHDYGSSGANSTLAATSVDSTRFPHSVAIVEGTRRPRLNSPTLRTSPRQRRVRTIASTTVADAVVAADTQLCSTKARALPARSSPVAISPDQRVGG
jgi:hypothetical protein